MTRICACAASWVCASVAAWAYMQLLSEIYLFFIYMTLSIQKTQAESVQISGGKYSWAVITYNPNGDLFINCDWGNCAYAFSFRSFGGDFKIFLLESDLDYIISKLEANSTKKHINKPTREALMFHLSEFRKAIA
jgi:hypothetical protein